MVQALLTNPYGIDGKAGGTEGVTPNRAKVNVTTWCQQTTPLHLAAEGGFDGLLRFTPYHSMIEFVECIYHAHRNDPGP